MVAIWIATIFFIMSVVCEFLHSRRVSTIASLAFGPSGEPQPWARLAPLLRVLSMTACVWALATLIILPPKVHGSEKKSSKDEQHLIVLLDVSPSMDVEDAGPTKNQSRRSRARDLLESIFKRTMVQSFKTSVFAVYTESHPVVEETTDAEIIRNILNDLPIHIVFTSGQTDLFAGLEDAANLAKPWAPNSTALILVSDGDTVPSTGMPRMPPSIQQVLVLGVGDTTAGKFIDGHQSRQDASTLRQIAARINGHYHNGNEHHLDTKIAQMIMAVPEPDVLERLSIREVALATLLASSLLLSSLPLLLDRFGTGWKPGVFSVRKATSLSSQSRRSANQETSLV